MEEIKKDCPCRRTACERYGKCRECLEYHAARRRPAYCRRAKTANKKKKESGE